MKEAPRPEGLVEGNRYDTSVAAEIVTAKYGYHLPIYRQQDYFAGSGWTPSRSTLLNILVASAACIRPFALYLREQVIASGVLGTDETRITLLLPPEIPAAIPGDAKSQRIYEVFTQSAGRRTPQRVGADVGLPQLDRCRSTSSISPSAGIATDPTSSSWRATSSAQILADCYSGYQGITPPQRRTDRARRLQCACPPQDLRCPRERSLVGQPLPGDLSGVVRHRRSRQDACRACEREALRAAEARPVWQRLRELLDGEAASRVLPKDKFAEALGYLRNHWDDLQVYLGDGRLPIDNNETEQLMKQVAIGRKNWLFVGSVAAGERAADFLTIVSSAVRNDLDVWAYVKEVLDRLLAGDRDYAALRPDRWAASHPEHVRSYRAEERRDRADAKQLRRAEHRRQANASR